MEWRKLKQAIHTRRDPQRRPGRKGPERRREKRIDPVAQLSCALGPVVNLSAMGMCVACADTPPVAVGHELEFTIRCGSGELRISSWIIWIRRNDKGHFEFGAKFSGIDRKVAVQLLTWAMVSDATADRVEAAALEVPTADPYAALGVSRHVSKDTIRDAYRKLARRFHPDASRAINAGRNFMAIHEAYCMLKDSAKRAAYDRSSDRTIAWDMIEPVLDDDRGAIDPGRLPIADRAHVEPAARVAIAGMKLNDHTWPMAPVRSVMWFAGTSRRPLAVADVGRAMPVQVPAADLQLARAVACVAVADTSCRSDRIDTSLTRSVAWIAATAELPRAVAEFRSIATPEQSILFVESSSESVAVVDTVRIDPVCVAAIADSSYEAPDPGRVAIEDPAPQTVASCVAVWALTDDCGPVVADVTPSAVWAFPDPRSPQAIFDEQSAGIVCDSVESTPGRPESEPARFAREAEPQWAAAIVDRAPDSLESACLTVEDPTTAAPHHLTVRLDPQTDTGCDVPVRAVDPPARHVASVASAALDMPCTDTLADLGPVEPDPIVVADDADPSQAAGAAGHDPVHWDPFAESNDPRIAILDDSDLVQPDPVVDDEVARFAEQTAPIALLGSEDMVVAAYAPTPESPRTHVGGEAPQLESACVRPIEDMPAAVLVSTTAIDPTTTDDMGAADGAGAVEDIEILGAVDLVFPDDLRDEPSIQVADDSEVIALLGPEDLVAEEPDPNSENPRTVVDREAAAHDAGWTRAVEEASADLPVSAPDVQTTMSVNELVWFAEPSAGQATIADLDQPNVVSCMTAVEPREGNCVAVEDPELADADAAPQLAVKDPDQATSSLLAALRYVPKIETPYLCLGETDPVTGSRLSDPVADNIEFIFGRLETEDQEEPAVQVEPVVAQDQRERRRMSLGTLLRALNLFGRTVGAYVVSSIYGGR